MNTKNATIKYARIEIEDHGILTVSIGCDFGGTFQGFGGYSLDHRDKDSGRTIGSRFGTEQIRRIMEAVGVREWSELKGKNIRVKKDGGWNTPITAIGHIVKDDWYDPRAHAAEVEA